MILDLVHNIALLVTLGVGLQVMARRLEERPALHGMMMGLLFGGAGIAGMMTPMQFAPGVIYDGRSIVLSLAGLFGGPVPAVLSATICGAYRLYLGGAGAPAGVSVIIEAALLGVVLHRLRRRDEAWMRPLRLWLFGVLVHVIMMLLQLMIPNVGWEILRRVGPSVLVFYPLGFLLIAQIFLDWERGRKVQRALRESERKYRELVHNASSIILRMDTAGTVTFFNEYAQAFFGYTEDEILGRNVVGTIVPPRETSGRDLEAMIQNIGRSPEDFAFNENENSRKDGDRVWVAWTNKGVLDSAGHLSEILCVGIDITDRKRAEEALRDSEGNFRSIFNTANDAIFIHDVNTGRIIDVNQKMCDMYGCTPDEARRFNVADISSGVPPYDQEHAVLFIRQAAAGSPQVFEWHARDRQGRLFWVEVSLKRAAIGKEDRILAIVRDITDRKRAEAEKLDLERQVQHAQKLESLGVLAGGIAHDFNNILAALVGYADLALADLRETHPAFPSIREIVAGARRAEELTRQLLAYSGKGQFVIERLDVSELMDAMAHLLRTSIVRTTALNLELQRGLPPIRGDAAQMQQVVMNLITNAAEAVGAQPGAITLSTGKMECASDYLAQSLVSPPSEKDAPSPGTYVYLEVRDTGCGMDEETKSRLFEPFFTTKFAGRGLGMAAVLGIVRGHRGAIMLESEPGKGSTFRVLFPTAEGQRPEPVQDKHPMPDMRVLRQRGTILVVDDEAAVCKMMTVALDRLGFAVLTAADGREGVEIFREHAAEIDCVFLDLTMPQMSGQACFEALREIRDGVKVIIMSGYTEQQTSERFPSESASGFLHKPFTMAALRRKMQEVLSP